MKPDQYFGKSKGAFPKDGVIGTESDWMEAGVLSVPYGKLWVGDLYVMEEDEGCVVSVPKGQYRVEVKGMDFKGHRRTARVRACLVDVTERRLGKKCGQLGIDCGMLGLYDTTAFKRTIGKEHVKQYGQDVIKATMEEIVGCVEHIYAGKTFEFAFLPAGLGDGLFKVYVLESARRIVGLEVEILPPGFSISHKRI